MVTLVLNKNFVIFCVFIEQNLKPFDDIKFDAAGNYCEKTIMQIPQKTLSFDPSDLSFPSTLEAGLGIKKRQKLKLFHVFQKAYKKLLFSIFFSNQF